MGDRMKQRATTLAESVHRRGLEQGIEQGIEQGMVRGRVATLLRLLEQNSGRSTKARDGASRVRATTS